MVTVENFRKYALSFPDVIESPHFEKTSFRINKKIFATLDTVNKTVVMKLSEIDQSVFCLHNTSIIYPVKGKWGKHGWTCFELKDIKREILKDALAAAYKTVYPKVAPKKLNH